MRVEVRPGTNDIFWSPWFGCFPISEACANCYIRSWNKFEDEYYPRDFASVPPHTLVVVGLNTDFFLPEADKYRAAVWNTIKSHPQLIFEIITKRVDRVQECLPEDWGSGYANVILAVTAETSIRANERIPLFLNIPCKHRWILCTPTLSEIDLAPYLKTNKIEAVLTSGERSRRIPARITRWEWIKKISETCKEYNVYHKILHLGERFVIADTTSQPDYSPCFKSLRSTSQKLDNVKLLEFELEE